MPLHWFYKPPKYLHLGILVLAGVYWAVMLVLGLQNDLRFLVPGGLIFAVYGIALFFVPPEWLRDRQARLKDRLKHDKDTDSNARQ